MRGVGRALWRRVLLPVERSGIGIVLGVAVVDVRFLNESFMYGREGRIVCATITWLPKRSVGGVKRLFRAFVLMCWN